MALTDRVARAWNAFMGRDPTAPRSYGISSGLDPDRPRLTRGNERSIVTSVLNRIATDAASIDVKHIVTDDNGRMSDIVNSLLNERLSLSANIDQTGRELRHDAFLTCLDKGAAAIVPVETRTDPTEAGIGDDILQMRVGTIKEWFPKHVKVDLYNDDTGQHKEITLKKSEVLILKNPFYAVMNEPNSTMQRLVRKLALLDKIDDENGAGKLDLIIQLPYIIKSEARKAQAEKRRKEIEEQLSGSKYGIAYTDGTEHITQLNRSLENQLLNQIQHLEETYLSQLGFTTGILDGTADESTMNNYFNRIIEPLLSNFVDEAKRKVLTKTAITQKQTIQFFRDPFKLMPISSVAEVADKFTRNEIMTANEVRQIVGMRPASDPKADELRNSNISAAKGEQHVDLNGTDIPDEAE